MTGLNNEEVVKNREQYGSNDIIAKRKNSFFKLLIESLGDPIIKILLIALGIKTIFLIKDFDWYETIGIVIAIFIASFISTISEYGSEKAFLSLQEEFKKIKCKVLRNGKKSEVPVGDIVVGDLVILESGDKIPADGILMKGTINVDESSLTGETKEKEKNKGDVLYRGSVVYSNNGMMKVNKVGTNTVYGTLALEVSEKAPDGPLKIRLRELAKVISKVGYIGAFLVAFAYLFSVIVIQNNFNYNLIMETIHNVPFITGQILYALTLCVTVIVVAVPEGLPMMITLVLSSNMKKMLKNNVLVRKLAGIETAGNLNILFTDKTGTLTKGQFEVVEIVDGNLNKYYQENDFKNKYGNIIKRGIVYNNNSYYSKGKIIGGNSTDRCILKFIKSDIKEAEKNIEIPFDSKNKYMITSIKSLPHIKLIKGAPELILDKCNYMYNEFGEKRSFYNKKNIELYLDEMTNRGIRIIALAEGTNTKLENLTFVGLILIKDDIREEAKFGIEMVKKANINTIMITGDNEKTAKEIARELNLLNDESIVITSYELSKMSDDKIISILPNLKVVARSLPKDKSRLVNICEKANLVVGMTGDGVNDAPALKKANVGFAMGSGTEVAKEASDIVILDNNFLSIAKTVLFGRTIFKSIRKFIIFQLTVNLCAISLSIIGPFIHVNTPITVIQMLWINMVMDTLAGLAFSYEPALIEYMNEKPIKKNENIINKYMFSQILITGLYSTILFILFLKVSFFKNLFRPDLNNKYFMTGFFALFIFTGIFNCFNSRTKRINVMSNILKNPMFIIIISFIVIVQLILIYFGGTLFRTSGLNLFELTIVILLSFTVVIVDMLRKFLIKLYKTKIKY